MIDPKAFEQNLARLCPDYRSKKFLLAVSGGIDSMTMMHLFRGAGLGYAIAHCNFGLRGAESQRDRDFVFGAAQEVGYEIFEIVFETQIFAQENHMSTQEAARKLRYDFFHETARQHSFDYICTAHHRDDVVETLLIGLNRKGGLSALAGIREMENQLLRPMLEFSRADIDSYAASQMISYVEDSSNGSDKYLRNRIRHQVMPALEQAMPGFTERAAASISMLRQYATWFSEMAETELALMGHPESEGIDLLKLQQSKMGELLLMHFLLKNGFNPSIAKGIFNITDHHEPRKFIAQKQELYVHRGRMILKTIEEASDYNTWYIEEDLDTQQLPISLTFSFETIEQPSELKADKNTAFLVADEIKFPLLVRKWQAGEHFMPFGMTGMKKIGDFFTDIKVTVAERDAAFVLCSENRIAWLIGYRADQRFAVTRFPARVLKVRLN